MGGRITRSVSHPCYSDRSPRAAQFSAGVRWAYLLSAGAPIAHHGPSIAYGRGLAGDGALR
jgi:hypothetical protein